MLKKTETLNLITQTIGSLGYKRRKASMAVKCIDHMPMPAAVLAALNSTCTRVRAVIEPQEIMRANFEEIICLGCGKKFIPKKRERSSLEA